MKISDFFVADFHQLQRAADSTTAMSDGGAPELESLNGFQNGLGSRSA
jgi:hypothetical protein